jgi:predicted Zn finger-like uncharacterized protein
MRFVCDSCRAQYMISDDKVGAKGVKVRCKKCGYVILVRRPEPISAPAREAQSSPMPHVLSDGPASAGQDEDPTGPGYGSSREAGRGILDGIADDEIGAVFDQVLSGSGGAPARSSDAGPDSDSNGQELTRGVDPGLLQKLLQSSQAVPDADRQPPADSPPQENGASYDWFVAVDEKQVGPLSFEQLKDYWNRGEIGPDSLCWRAGLSDWITLSEAPELATLLAPKPNRPVIVAAAPVTSPGLAASGPVESAFSAGAPSKSVRLEPVAAAAEAHAASAEPGGWKPSAASALASLMKEEIDALKRPAPASKHLDQAPSEPVLLDVPAPVANGRHGTSAIKTRTEDGAVRSSPGAPAATDPYPSFYGYGAAASSRRGWLIGLSIGGGVLLLALVVVTTILVLRSGSSEPTASTQEKSKTSSKGSSGAASADREQASGTSGPTSPGQAANASSSAGGQPNQAATPPAAKTADAKSESPATAAKTEPSASAAKAETGAGRIERNGTHQRIRPPRTGSPEEITVPRKSEKPEVVAQAAKPSSDDDFDREFGGADKRRAPAPKSEPPKRQTSVYVPPAPGAELPESLGTSDIMEVVRDNKGSIVKCVDEQKKRDSSLAGPIVMTWTILASGKTTNISCASDAFKGSYLAQCMTGLIKSWQFPRHKVQGEPINFPFKF